MNVTLIQADLSWNAPKVNRAYFEQKIEQAGKTDLIVLPEMFSTGFCIQPRGVAEPVGGPTLTWMQEIACSKGIALSGSIATEVDGHYYNRFYFVFPDGTYRYYDKRHLFTFGGEHLEYTGGQERVIVAYKGWNILLQVCYDLRFPVWSRNRGDYDMVLYVASWPTPRVAAWNALLRARAIENLCYVAGVNRVGDDPNCNYCGGSVLLDFLGQPLAEGVMGSEGILHGTLDREALTAFRAKFPALQDGDVFTLEK